MTQYLINLLPVVVGGLLVWIGSYLSDRRRLSLDKRASLRTAYARWFTSEKFLKEQIEGLYSLVKGLPENIDEHNTFVQETKNLIPAVQNLIQLLHEIYLLEPDLGRRSQIRFISEGLESLHAAILEEVIHQKHHIETRNIFNEFQVELA